MNEHTPEPWVVSLGSDVGSRVYVRPADRSKAVAEVTARVGEQMANARRIVACVNACAGVPTENLEALHFHGSMATVFAEAADLTEALRLLGKLAAFATEIPDDEAIIHGDEMPLWAYNYATLTYGDVRRAAAFLARFPEAVS